MPKTVTQVGSVVSGSGTVTGNQSITSGWSFPADIQEGDVTFWVVTWDQEYNSSVSGYESTGNLSITGSHRFRIMMRRYESGDSQPTFNLTGGSSTVDYAYQIFTFRNVLSVGSLAHDSDVDQLRGGAVQFRGFTETASSAFAVQTFSQTYAGTPGVNSVCLWIAAMFNNGGGSWDTGTVLDSVESGSDLSLSTIWETLSTYSNPGTRTFTPTTGPVDALGYGLVLHPAPLDDDPAVHSDATFCWSFDGHGNEVLAGDLHGRRDNSLFDNQVTGIVPNSSGQAMQFNSASNSQLRIDDDELINTSGSYAGNQRGVMFYMNADTDQGTAGNGQAIWTQGGGTNGFSVYLYDGYIYVACNESGNSRGYARAPYVVGTTYFVAAGFNVSGNGDLDSLNQNQDQSMFIYIDGELVEFGDAQFGTDLASHSGNNAIGLPDSSTLNHLGNSITGVFNGKIQGFGYYGDSLNVNGNRIWRRWRESSTADQTIPYEVDGTSGYAANNTSVTLDMGTGAIEEGDLMVCYLWNVNSLNWDAAPSGWTARTGNRSQNNVVARMYTKVADASDVTDPSVTFTVPANGNLFGRATAIRGTSGIHTEDFNAMPSNAYESITTSENNCLVQCIAGWDQGELLTSYTTINHVGGVVYGSGSSAGSFYHGNFVQRSAGATGDKTGQSMVSFRDLVGGQVAFAPSSTPVVSNARRSLIGDGLTQGLIR